MRLTKKEMIKIICKEVIQYGECLCENGKGCAFCFALILKGEHAEWEWSPSEKQVVKRLKKLAKKREVCEL